MKSTESKGNNMNQTITCACKVCKSNAETLGAVTLSASVPAALLNRLGDTKRIRHALVREANDPSPIARLTSAKMGIVGCAA